MWWQKSNTDRSARAGLTGREHAALLGNKVQCGEGGEAEAVGGLVILKSLADVGVILASVSGDLGDIARY